MKKLFAMLLFFIILNTVTFASIELPEYIKVKTSDGNIVKLELEEYIYGVVQSEIGINYKSIDMEQSQPVPMEALKAQAIASRTYAVYNILSKGEDVQYHVANGNQVYKNVTVNENVKKAVDETCGQIVVYDGKVANTFFFATSGGYTENSENVWSSTIPYLRAVEDKYEINVKNHTKWTAIYEEEDLEKIFPSIGKIKDIKITQYSENNRVTELKVIGESGTEILTKNTIRMTLGSNKLRSQWFEIEKDETSFIFTGRGYGHAVGMSQNGAIGMAENGFSYDEIIKWYYTDVEIQGLDETSEGKDKDEINYKDEKDNEDEEEMKPLLKELMTALTTNWLLKAIK